MSKWVSILVCERVSEWVNKSNNIREASSW